MSELGIDGMVKHLPRTHRARLELTDLRSQLSELIAQRDKAVGTLKKFIEFTGWEGRISAKAFKELMKSASEVVEEIEIEDN